MKKNLIILLTLLALVLTACGGEAPLPPTPSQAQIELAMAQLQTEEALNNPSPTPLPPTDTPPPTETPQPSETPLPTETATEVPSATPTIVWPTYTPTPTAIDLAKGEKVYGVARLKLTNSSEEDIYLILSGALNEEYRFKKTFYFNAPWGDYKYTAWIGNKGPYIGTFSITNSDKYELVFFPDKIVVRIP